MGGIYRPSKGGGMGLVHGLGVSVGVWAIFQPHWRTSLSTGAASVHHHQVHIFRTP